MGLRFTVPHNSVHEAGKLAEHPHSIGTQVATNAVGSTAAGVGAYQLNSHLARKQGQEAPNLSVQTGSMPNPTGENISKAATRTRKKYTKSRKGD